MTVKIVLPSEEGINPGWTTRVINEQTGCEIDHISKIVINIEPESIITATLTVAVGSIENAQGIEGLVIIGEPENATDLGVKVDNDNI